MLSILYSSRYYIILMRRLIR